MKSIYLLLTILFMNLMHSQEATTIYLIRHAEKAVATGDPDLSEGGKARAAQWAEWLGDKKYIYAIMNAKLQYMMSMLLCSSHV